MTELKRAKRVGFILSETLDRNIEIYCAASGTPKTALANHVFANFLEQQGFSRPRDVVQVPCEPLNQRVPSRVTRRRATSEPVAIAG